MFDWFFNKIAILRSQFPPFFNYKNNSLKKLAGSPNLAREDDNEQEEPVQQSEENRQQIKKQKEDSAKAFVNNNLTKLLEKSHGVIYNEATDQNKISGINVDSLVDGILRVPRLQENLRYILRKNKDVNKFLQQLTQSGHLDDNQLNIDAICAMYLTAFLTNEKVTNGSVIGKYINEAFQNIQPVDKAKLDEARSKQNELLSELNFNKRTQKSLAKEIAKSKKEIKSKNESILALERAISKLKTNADKEQDATNKAKMLADLKQKQEKLANAREQKRALEEHKAKKSIQKDDQSIEFPVTIEEYEKVKNKVTDLEKQLNENSTNLLESLDKKQRRDLFNKIVGVFERLQLGGEKLSGVQYETYGKDGKEVTDTDRVRAEAENAARRLHINTSMLLSNLRRNVAIENRGDDCISLDTPIGDPAEELTLKDVIPDHTQTMELSDESKEDILKNREHILNSIRRVYGEYSGIYRAFRSYIKQITDSLLDNVTEQEIPTWVMKKLQDSGIFSNSSFKTRKEALEDNTLVKYRGKNIRVGDLKDKREIIQTARKLFKDFVSGDRNLVMSYTELEAKVNKFDELIKEYGKVNYDSSATETDSLDNVFTEQCVNSLRAMLDTFKKAVDKLGVSKDMPLCIKSGYNKQQEKIAELEKQIAEEDKKLKDPALTPKEQKDAELLKTKHNEELKSVKAEIEKSAKQKVANYLAKEEDRINNTINNNKGNVLDTIHNNTIYQLQKTGEEIKNRINDEYNYVDKDVLTQAIDASENLTDEKKKIFKEKLNSFQEKIKKDDIKSIIDELSLDIITTNALKTAITNYRLDEDKTINRFVSNYIFGNINSETMNYMKERVSDTIVDEHIGYIALANRLADSDFFNTISALNWLINEKNATISKDAPEYAKKFFNDIKNADNFVDVFYNLPSSAQREDAQIKIFKDLLPNLQVADDSVREELKRKYNLKLGRNNMLDKTNFIQKCDEGKFNSVFGIKEQPEEKEPLLDTVTEELKQNKDNVKMGVDGNYYYLDSNKRWYLVDYDAWNDTYYAIKKVDEPNLTESILELDNDAPVQKYTDINRQKPTYESDSREDKYDPSFLFSNISRSDIANTSSDELVDSLYWLRLHKNTLHTNKYKKEYNETINKFVNEIVRRYEEEISTIEEDSIHLGKITQNLHNILNNFSGYINKTKVSTLFESAAKKLLKQYAKKAKNLSYGYPGAGAPMADIPIMYAQLKEYEDVLREDSEYATTINILEQFMNEDKKTTKTDKVNTEQEHSEVSTNDRETVKNTSDNQEQESKEKNEANNQQTVENQKPKEKNESENQSSDPDNIKDISDEEPFTTGDFSADWNSNKEKQALFQFFGIKRTAAFFKFAESEDNYTQFNPKREDKEQGQIEDFQFDPKNREQSAVEDKEDEDEFSFERLSKVLKPIADKAPKKWAEIKQAVFQSSAKFGEDLLEYLELWRKHNWNAEAALRAYNARAVEPRNRSYFWKMFKIHVWPQINRNPVIINTVNALSKGKPATKSDVDTSEIK